MKTMNADAIVGSWLSADSKFRFEIHRENDSFYGIIAEGLDNGERDAANPDPEKRSRLILGIRIFEGLKFTGNHWSGGRLYHPESGKTFGLNISKSDDTLLLRAYMGHPALGQTIKWESYRLREDLQEPHIRSLARLDDHPAWSPQRAREWYASRPWPVGCNYIPSDAVNQLEMWQEASFNPDLIARELELARSLGFNTLRVYLHDALWKTDAEGLIRRMDTFLDCASKKGLKTMFVLFDDCWNDFYRTGRQPGPRPGIHNSGWVRGPGSRVIADVGKWPRLESYVRGIVGAFRSDERILAWDVYNEFGNSAGILPDSCSLLASIFQWVRESNPVQPVTSGVWKYAPWYDGINRFLVSQSDIITFHDYSRIESMKARIEMLSASGKPLICTEYMARTQGSLFRTHLPHLKKTRTGAINWGLTAGKTQTWLPWNSRKGDGEPAIWFHDIFRKDSTPWDPEEVEFIRSMTFQPSSI